jgi:head-tail adaptor
MLKDFFNSSAEVQQISRRQVGSGGVKKSFSTRIAALACRLRRKTISELDEYGKKVIKATHRLYCEATSANRAITASDRIILSGTTYEVTGIYNPGSLNRHLEIDVLEVE